MNSNTTKDSIQKFGRFLSGMVLPNIGAFIAWGLITALFIPTGWLPNENLSSLVGPMILNLLPILIGYTGGRLVAGQRGAVMGAIATMGVVVGADIPMFLGAMIMGPLGGLIIRKFDAVVEGKIPSGFEMLVNNFSIGILGTALALAAYLGIGPVVLALNSAISAGVGTIVNAGLLPLVSLFIEPGKILFLNNAMNHGVLTPLGIQEAQEMGKSIIFLLETNPGPGLGILLAYWVFGKGMVKNSAPGSIIIHFLGGIHEIYFPYVMMNPALILAVIAGGASGVLTFSMLGAGLIASPSPGSIFALLAMTPKGGFFGVVAGVAVSASVSFAVASIFVKKSASNENESALEDAQSKLKVMKNISKGRVQKIVFACDAGMGSSAMGASSLRKKLEKNGIKIEVVHSAVDEVPKDADIVLCHESLAGRAKSRAPQAEHIGIKEFINNPVYDVLVERLRTHGEQQPLVETTSHDLDKSTDVLDIRSIQLNCVDSERDLAIKRAGNLLVEHGYVSEEYVDGMLKREQLTSTYIGNGVAIPHGTNDSKTFVKKTGIVILQYPEGVSYGEDQMAHLIIGIAAKGEEHMDILSNIAESIGDMTTMDKITKTQDVEFIYELFSKVG